MGLRFVLTMGAVVVCQVQIAMAFELPKEVTPAVRAACEQDVRRLCIRKDSTVASVKSCVRRNFSSLNSGCKFQLALAGLGQ